MASARGPRPAAEGKRTARVHFIFTVTVSRARARVGKAASDLAAWTNPLELDEPQAFPQFVGFVGLGWTLLDRASSLISHTPIRKARIESLCVSFLPCLRFM